VLLLTHAHFDHVIDAARIRERFSCPLQAFTTPDTDLTLESAYRDLGVRVEHYLVDKTISARLPDYDRRLGFRLFPCARSFAGQCLLFLAV